MLSVSDAGAAVLLLLALVSDVLTLRIPNVLTVPAFAVALLYHCVAEGVDGGIYALAGALAGLVPLLALHLLKGIGAGDVKLFAALGAWVGAYFILQTMMYAIIYAGAVGLVLILVKGAFGQRFIAVAVMLLMHKEPGRSVLPWMGTGQVLRFPFMIAAVPGAVTAWLMVGG